MALLLVPVLLIDPVRSSSKYASLFTCTLGCAYAHDVNFVIRTVYACTIRVVHHPFFLNSAYNANAALTCTSDSFCSTQFVHKVSTLNQAVVSLSKKKWRKRNKNNKLLKVAKTISAHIDERMCKWIKRHL